MNESECRNELERLEKILYQIKRELDNGTDNYQTPKNELQEALVNYWENPYADFWDQSQLTESVQRQRSLAAAAYHRRAQFEKMMLSPYFGRIDFAEESSGNLKVPEPFYIGTGTLADPETMAGMIYDWRSPVAGMFYDYEPGPSEYQCPAGIIRGQITLKRQYKIKNGRMEYMFDSELKIDDEILQELLGKSVDAKMRTIVNTIQREQNRVIRDERHPVLVVLGPAGSGKTSIVLHRAAYLLYRERNAITARNILIFSPNRIFSDYISGVLPELGEENVMQTTFRDYIHRRISGLPIDSEEWNAQMEYLLTGFEDYDYQPRVAGIRYKSSLEFAEVIENYLSYLENRLIQECHNIEFQGRMILSREEWKQLFAKNLAYLPVMERLQQIKRRIQLKLQPLVHELRREKEKEIVATGEEVNERTIKALARLAARKEFVSLMTEVDRLTALEPLALYRRLFEDGDLFCRLAQNTVMPESWQKICTQTLAWLNKGRISYEDLIPFLYFQGCLAGFPIKTSIRRVIIDEAQDYTALQYKIMQRLFPKCSWTILGDPDQSVSLYHQEIGFESAARIINEDVEPLIIKLVQSYRSTQEIQAFCRALLHNAEPVAQIRRSGLLPQLIKVQSPGLIPEAILTAIQEVREEGWRSIAVIGKTAQESALVYQALKSKTEITLITWEMEEFQRGTVVIPAYLAKGLEFDAVLISDIGYGAYAHEVERSILYIACTRALHRLNLYYCGDLSPFILTMDSGLYQTVGS